MDSLPDEPPARDHLDRRFILAARTIVVLFRDLERVARGADITIPQYRFMLMLKRGPKRAIDLAQAAAIGRPAASALVADMEKRGLIAREADISDGRAFRLRLTAEGVRRHAQFEEALARYLPTVFEQGDAERLLQAFDELAYVLDARRHDGPLDPLSVLDD
ncbi:MarR family winged helix-turn-helix transcriptional regulator [Zavarzinia sp. CC-PAN008]|uniref:MarR family winged helix-turn-helix transcriptional regulator n=1 Tax=Zavarzinia sp. CC-PAN008 TaxID=3243332 RepID=UPI003F744B9D